MRWDNVWKAEVSLAQPLVDFIVGAAVKIGNWVNWDECDLRWNYTWGELGGVIDSYSAVGTVPTYTRSDMVDCLSVWKEQRDGSASLASGWSAPKLAAP